MSNQIQNLPVHVAITMDGNGRWATNQNLPRTAGHNEGKEQRTANLQRAGAIGCKPGQGSVVNVRPGAEIS